MTAIDNSLSADKEATTEATQNQSRSANAPTRKPYASRPDPDEPWRYACPDCSSPSLIEYQTRSATDRYACDDCGSCWDFEQLEDRAGGRDD